ncbi:hypothetical protein N7481_002240 [Penicillium waksmanii]|uniref:uncharacterized protein n=1 Tax=Penicillium waksmanii TaxID=69791 RepID=UPI002547B2D0|nr:uncharacterized protein N7481_002240 [Penicillium waksmanii]KAJ5995263.1 hypothetical protein N7481_002240 [Penicillium waksmanii]
MGRQYLKEVTGLPGLKTTPNMDVSAIVKDVIDSIRKDGDAAVRKYSKKFDKWSPPSFKLSQSDINAAIASCPKQTLEDIEEVQQNVREFAKAQRNSIKDFEVELRPGIHLGQKNVPIDNVGAYIPGGRYPLLASAHMTILTAKVAGVKNVIGCTPPINGKVPNSTVAAMHLAGADEIFILGGVQAVAAMAVGTEAIQKVDFLAGPGNAFVAEGKRQLFGEVGIDLFAGPTEILVLADETADAFTVATDLISQAEHGPDTPAVLITTCPQVGRDTIEIVERLLYNSDLSTASVAKTSWDAFGEVIVVDTMDEMWELGNQYASEHVIGTNHVLPTRTTSRYTGGLWVGKYLKTCTYQEVTSEQASGNLGRLCGRAARAENFEAHARSGDLRASKYKKDHIQWIKKSQAVTGVRL